MTTEPLNVYATRNQQGEITAIIDYTGKNHQIYEVTRAGAEFVLNLLNNKTEEKI